MDAVAKSKNPVDIWMHASVQELIDLVRREMEQYHLYAVVPKLVGFIDILTNWYVRLNRFRLRDGDITGLSVLYSTLLTLSRLMAPVTPFFAEYLYQNLRKYHPSLNDEDAAPDAIGKRCAPFVMPLFVFTHLGCCHTLSLLIWLRAMTTAVSRGSSSI